MTVRVFDIGAERARRDEARARSHCMFNGQQRLDRGPLTGRLVEVEGLDRLPAICVWRRECGPVRVTYLWPLPEDRRAPLAEREEIAQNLIGIYHVGDKGLYRWVESGPMPRHSLEHLGYPT